MSVIAERPLTTRLVFRGCIFSTWAEDCINDGLGIVVVEVLKVVLDRSLINLV
jgi:hypothetical protein